MKWFWGLLGRKRYYLVDYQTGYQIDSNFEIIRSVDSPTDVGHISKDGTYYIIEIKSEIQVSTAHDQTQTLEEIDYSK